MQDGFQQLVLLALIHFFLIRARVFSTVHPLLLLRSHDLPVLQEVVRFWRMGHFVFKFTSEYTDYTQSSREKLDVLPEEVIVIV